MSLVTAAKLCSFLLGVETLFIHHVVHNHYKGDINEENLLFGRQCFPFVGAELVSSFPGSVFRRSWFVILASGDVRFLNFFTEESTTQCVIVKYFGSL